MKILTIANQKGGVAKTTTASALASGLTSRNKKVLIIDLDPQGNLSYGFGANLQAYTIYDVLKDKINIVDSIQKINGIDIVPANILLAGSDTEFVQLGREYILKEKLENLSGYDYIILDTPPNLGILTINAFVCSDEIIIPTTTNIYSIQGIMQLNQIIKKIQKGYNNNLIIKGVLLTKYQSRANIAKELKTFTQDIVNQLNTKVFNTIIRNSIKVEESQVNQESLFLNKNIASED